MARRSLPGRLVDVGGHRLHVRELGHGPATVLLEAGAGGSGEHWGEVPAMLAGSARVLAYDRAGLGHSDRARQRRTARALTADTLALLDALSVNEPVIAVGHSFGASLVRLLALQYPQRVSGLVFVDGWHESMADWERSRGLHVEPPRWLRRVLGLLSPLKLTRVIEALREADAYEEVDRVNREAGGMAVPVRALVSQAMLGTAEAPRGYPVAEHNAAWIQSSSRLGTLSADSSVVVLAGCDHHVPLRRPDAVVDAVEDLMSALARTGPL